MIKCKEKEETNVRKRKKNSKNVRDIREKCINNLETGGRGGEERRIKESRIEKKNVFNLIETMANGRQFMIWVPKKN